jgi:CRISPR-associated protein Csy2
MALEGEEAAGFSELERVWLTHLEKPYLDHVIPDVLIKYFADLEPDKTNSKLLQQWRAYLEPNEETDADWEYVPKPCQGYLVPIMAGYKAISPVYELGKVQNTRDCETPVCFVEAVYSVGEWMSIHRIKTVDELRNSLWQVYFHLRENWKSRMA